MQSHKITMDTKMFLVAQSALIRSHDYHKLRFIGTIWSGIVVMAKLIFPELLPEPHKALSQVSKKVLWTIGVLRFSESTVFTLAL